MTTHYGQVRDAYPESQTIFAPAARTTAPADVEVGTQGASGLLIVANATAETSTAVVTITVQGVVYPAGAAPDATAVTWDIGSLVIDDVETVVLQIHPALLDSVLDSTDVETVTGKVAALIPDRVRFHVTVADADSLTYSVVAILTP